MALLAGSPSRAVAGPHDDFVGSLSEDVFYRDAGYRAQMLPVQWDTGVRIVRQDFEWWRIEPTEGRYDFSYYDAFVGDLARRGLRVLPVLLAPPRFRSLAPAGDRSGDMYPPRSSQEYAQFAAAVARRYGPGGSFWSANPGLPQLAIRSWQIWNEPNLRLFWGSGPDAAAYSRMLSAAAGAIEQVDPAAEIVGAGMPQSSLDGAVPLVRYMEEMYAAGTPRFDTFALHAYAPDPASSLALARRVRSVLDSHGDHAPIWITEFGWATGGRQSAFTVDEQTQAAYIERAIALYARASAELRLRGLVLFKWRDSHSYKDSDYIWPHFAGLLRADGSPKPAFFAFRRAVRNLAARTQAPAPRCAERRAGVARSFAGVSPGSLLRHSPTYRACQIRTLAAAGVGLVRQRFVGPPRAKWDRVVLELAAAGIRVLPVVEPRANWSAARLAGALVARYGPAGTIWEGVPTPVRRPVMELQVLGHLARVRSARWYQRVLRQVRRRVDERDRRVGLVTASLGPPGAARLLTSLYRLGGRRPFDTVAVDLGRRSPGQQVSILRRLHRLMRARGDRTSRLLPTGVGWPSGGSRRAGGPRGQAERVRLSLRLVLCRRRSLGVRAFVYGRWRDAASGGGTTGLLDVRGHPKPALKAFRSAAESCR